jgi:hypothetical protein
VLRRGITACPPPDLFLRERKMHETRKKIEKIEADKKELDHLEDTGKLSGHELLNANRKYNKKIAKVAVEVEKTRRAEMVEEEDRYIENGLVDAVSSTFNHPSSVVIENNPIKDGDKQPCTSCGSTTWNRLRVTYYPNRIEICDQCES